MSLYAGRCPECGRRTDAIILATGKCAQCSSRSAHRKPVVIIRDYGDDSPLPVTDAWGHAGPASLHIWGINGNGF